MEVAGVVAVETAEGGEPYLPAGVFDDIVDALVGQAGGETVGAVGSRPVGFGGTAAGGCHHDKAEKNAQQFFHGND